MQVKILIKFYWRKTEELTDIELNDEQISTIESEKEEQETVDNTKVIQLEKEIETLQVLQKLLPKCKN